MNGARDPECPDCREHPRAVVETSAIVLVRHNAATPFVIESISVGGARLAGPLTLGIGERVQILFEIDGSPVDVEGEVIRVERQDIVNDRVAVRFKNLSAGSRALIHQLVVRTLETLEYDS